MVFTLPAQCCWASLSESILSMSNVLLSVEVDSPGVQPLGSVTHRSPFYSCNG